jgi:hypothetical protein
MHEEAAVAFFNAPFSHLTGDARTFHNSGSLNSQSKQQSVDKERGMLTTTPRYWMPFLELHTLYILLGSMSFHFTLHKCRLT